MKTAEQARLIEMTIQRATEAEALFTTALEHRIVVFKAEVGADLPGLLPEESALTTSMSSRRRAAFTAGRAAAHAGLDHLGIERHALLIGLGGAPQWPIGVVGSITHTDRVAYAAVGIEKLTPSAMTSSVVLGIDTEDRGRIESSIVPTIMTDAEQATWTKLEANEADIFATTTFSAKEALYKAQFAVTGTWLGFEHIEMVRRQPAHLERHAPPFEVAMDIDELEQSPLLPGIERPMRARSLVLSDLVISAVILRLPTGPPSSGQPASRARSN